MLRSFNRSSRVATSTLRCTHFDSGRSPTTRYFSSVASGDSTLVGTVSGSSPRDLEQAERLLSTSSNKRGAQTASDATIARDVPVIPFAADASIGCVRVDRAGVRSVRQRAGELPFWNAENWWLAE